MSLDPETSGALAVWAAQQPAQPAVGVAAPVRPAHYQPRHRRGQRTNTGRWIVAEPVGPDYNPLAASARAALAPTHWSDPDRWLPAGPDAVTGRVDPAAVLAGAADRTAAPPAEVLAELRLDIATTWAALGDPAADVARIFQQIRPVQ